MKEPVAGRHSLVRLYILDKPPGQGGFLSSLLKENLEEYGGSLQGLQE